MEINKKIKIPEGLLEDLKENQKRLEAKEKEIIQFIFDSELESRFPDDSENETFFKDGKFICETYSNFSYRTDYLGLVASTKNCSVEMKNLKEDGKFKKISYAASTDSCDSGYSSSETISIDNIRLVNFSEKDQGYREYCGEDSDEDDDDDEEEEEEEEEDVEVKNGAKHSDREEEKDGARKKKAKKCSEKEIAFLQSFFDQVEEFLFSKERGGGWGMDGRWDHCH
jgi:hypothetical protein